MSQLHVYQQDNPSHVINKTSEVEEITGVLNSVGVRFEQWSTDIAIKSDMAQEQVIAAYQDDVDRLMKEGGYQAVDVISLASTNPAKAELRKKFLDEHVHSEDEVRFFVRGDGLFYLHIEQNVYVVLCEAGDLISVPANATHWFDMGDEPDFTAIRLFTNPEGWVAQYTGNDIAKKFPKYEDLV